MRVVRGRAPRVAGVIAPTLIQGPRERETRTREITHTTCSGVAEEKTVKSFQSSLFRVHLSRKDTRPSRPKELHTSHKKYTRDQNATLRANSTVRRTHNAVVWASGLLRACFGRGNLVEGPRVKSQGQIYGSGWTRTLVSLVLVCLPDSWRAIVFDARL